MDELISFRMIYLLAEVLAAIVGTFVYTRCRIDYVRHLVVFLWFTIFIEITCTYTYFVHRGYLCFLDDGSFSKNFWLFNIYTLVSFAFYVTFFKNLIKNVKASKYISIALVVYITSAIINLIFSEVFFRGNSSYSFIVGVLILLTVILLYFYEILQSDEILSFKNSLPFYISVGTLVIHLCIIPIFIFSKYYRSHISPEFVNVFGIIVNLANIFLYTCYSIGFIVCYKKNKSYS